MKHMHSMHAALLLATLVGTTTAQEIFEITAADAQPNDFFGQSVAVSQATAVLGAARSHAPLPDSGAAYIFELGVGQTKLSASDGSFDDELGFAVAISADTVVAGAYGDDHVAGSDADEGSAYVFFRSGGVWSEQAKLIASDPDVGDLFGYSVAVDGDTTVVGAPFDDDGGSDSGSVHVFTRSGAVWSHQAKVTAGDAQAGDRFGTAVSVHGDTLLVGAARANAAGSNGGAAYVFTRAAGVWTQEAKLVAGDAAQGDELGRAVSLEGDTAVVGAYKHDGIAIDSGAAYVFTRAGTVWTEQAKLEAGDAAALDSFGASVSLSGSTIVVGAFGKADAGTASGAAYVFVDDGGWQQVDKLVPNETAARDFFGSTVAISDDLIVVGSGWDDDDGINSGSAHLFQVDSGPQLAAPVPGTAGALNTVNVTDATPGGLVGLGFSLSMGSTPVGGICPGLTVDLANPNVLGLTNADGSGDASFTGFVPGSFLGTTAFIQAVDVAGCEVTNLVTHTFL